MKIAVIGAGWYGCHIASNFMAMGFEVAVYDKSDRVMDGASGNNQYRLHQGFHYARSHRTRVQSRDGFARFLERYSYLSAPIENNIYVVPTRDSLIDFPTYRMIMSASGLEFIDISPEHYGISNCSGGLRVQERVIFTSKARAAFTKRLGSNLRLGHSATTLEFHGEKIFVDGEFFDYVVDATWGRLTPISHDIFFEPTLLLIYRSITVRDFALTAVDGQLCSIYPCEQPEFFTLSSVSHTPLGQFETFEFASDYLQSDLISSAVDKKRELMEHQIELYYQAFRENFEYVGPQFSVKTKIRGSTDNRSCYVEKRGKLFQVLSGKIDNIFYASDSILSMIEAEHGAFGD